MSPWNQPNFCVAGSQRRAPLTILAFKVPWQALEGTWLLQILVAVFSDSSWIADHELTDPFSLSENVPKDGARYYFLEKCLKNNLSSD